MVKSTSSYTQNFISAIRDFINAVMATLNSLFVMPTVILEMSASVIYIYI